MVPERLGAAFLFAPRALPFVLRDRPWRTRGGSAERDAHARISRHVISANLVQLADTLASKFRVVVPSILGRDGDPTAGDSLRQICVRREVHLLARHGVSADVGWLRDFADEHVARRSGESYGVVGMCFTGNFALALAVDPRVNAAVVAQPTIPLWPRALGLSAADRKTLRGRTDLRVQGYRFRCDPLSPAAKLASARGLLGPEKIRTFPLSEPNARQHSTLTGTWRNEEAVQGVMAFLMAWYS